jgi:hypothetical protein
MNAQEEKAAAYRSLFEDVLDVALFILGAMFLFVVNDLRAEISQKTLWWIAASGAGARMAARRIVNKVIDIKLLGKLSSSIEKPPAS